jgi:hypothetical protein
MVVLGLKAKQMSEPKKGLAGLELDDAIRLRWALRDIKGKRLKLTPVDPNDMRTLIDMGYVEMINDQPVVTAAGSQQIEIGD